MSVASAPGWNNAHALWRKNLDLGRSLTNDDLDRLVPHVAALGFDWLELPLEFPGSFDCSRAAMLIGDHLAQQGLAFLRVLLA